MSRTTVIGIFIALVVLGFLIVITFVLRSTGRIKNPETNVPFPTSSLDSQFGVNFNRTGKFTLGKIAANNTKGLSEEELKALEEFKNKLPVSNEDYEIRYSDELNQFFIQPKDQEAKDNLNKFLEDNDLLEIFNNHPGLITVIEPNDTEGIDEKIKVLVDEIDEENDIKDKDDSKNTPPETSEQRRRRDDQARVDNFRRLGSNLLSFDIGGGYLTGVLKGITTPSDNQDNPPPGGSLGDDTNNDGELQTPPNLGGPNSLGYVQMPEPKNNDYVFSEGACPAQRYGTEELINVLYTVALNYKAKFPSSRLRIGDINASHFEHCTHHYGVGADITESVNGGKGAAACMDCAGYTAEVRQRTIELGKIFINTKMIRNIFYDDSFVTNALNEYARANNLPVEGVIKPIGGHGDHFHVDIKAQFRGPDHHPTCDGSSGPPAC